MPRKTRKPEIVSTLLNSSSGTLAQIAEKTNSLKQLSAILRQICPDLPEDAWEIANFRKNTIIIEVKSSAWGQRLQFERMKICRELASRTENRFSQIEIKVNPHQARKYSATENKSFNKTNEAFKRTHFISKKAAEHIENVASSMPEKLRIKLQSLARLAKKNK